MTEFDDEQIDDLLRGVEQTYELGEARHLWVTAETKPRELWEWFQSLPDCPWEVIPVFVDLPRGQQVPFIGMEVGGQDDYLEALEPGFALESTPRPHHFDHHRVAIGRAVDGLDPWFASEGGVSCMSLQRLGIEPRLRGWRGGAVRGVIITEYAVFLPLGDDDYIQWRSRFAGDDAELIIRPAGDQRAFVERFEKFLGPDAVGEAEVREHIDHLHGILERFAAGEKVDPAEWGGPEPEDRS